jgi:hypothetical protein
VPTALDSRTGYIVCESSGEDYGDCVLSPTQTVALEQIAKKLLIRMIRDGLLESKTETQLILNH